MIQRPADRYGSGRLTPRTRRWVLVALVALVVIAGVAIAGVAAKRFGTGEVKGEMAAYRLIDDKTVEVTVSVTRDDPSRPVVCIVRARSADGSETGRREVLVAPSAQATVQVTTIVKASRPPAVGDVYGCGTNVPGYLVAS
jgi:uncharacterized protein (DUF58 family)